MPDGRRSPNLLLVAGSVSLLYVSSCVGTNGREYSAGIGVDRPRDTSIGRAARDYRLGTAISTPLKQLGADETAGAGRSRTGEGRQHSPWPCRTARPLMPGRPGQGRGGRPRQEGFTTGGFYGQGIASMTVVPWGTICAAGRRKWGSKVLWLIYGRISFWS